MVRPPVIKCPTIDLDHGLAESGWLRKLRFNDAKMPAQASGLETSIEPPETSGGQTTRDEEKLSVEQWVTDMLSMEATAAKTRTVTVPSIVCTAFARNGKLGLLLVNLKPDHQVVKLELNPADYGIDSSEYQTRIRTQGVAAITEIFDHQKPLRLDLPPREVVLLEVEAVGDDK